MGASGWSSNAVIRDTELQSVTSNQILTKPYLERAHYRLIEALSQSTPEGENLDGIKTQTKDIELEKLRLQSLQRLRVTWERIFEKYGKKIDCNEIDLRRIRNAVASTGKKRGRKKVHANPQSPQDVPLTPPSANAATSNSPHRMAQTPTADEVTVSEHRDVTPIIRRRRRKRRRKSGILFTRQRARSKASVLRLKLAMTDLGSLSAPQDLVFDDDAFENILE